jgi:hypothetical protein
MIDVFDILFVIALMLSIGCLYVSYLIFKSKTNGLVILFVLAFILLVFNRLVTVLNGFDIKILSQDYSSSIGVITIAFLLIGMIGLLKR